MKWIDMHCDTLSQEGGLWENQNCTDLKRLQKSGAVLQFFACFVDAAAYGRTDDGRTWEQAYSHACSMAKRAKKEEKDGFYFLDSLKDISEEGRLYGMLTLEEGGVLNGNTDRLEDLYGLGIRLVTLTWNYENCIGSPNSSNPGIMNSGLKPFGLEVIEKMNRLGMIIDVSHLSDGGFWDCIRYSKMPVVASHSNARGLCPHPRNLSDQMLAALGNSGGVAGVNFHSMFLRRKAEKEQLAEVKDIVMHLKYMSDKAGEDAVCIGTDFDGFDPLYLPQGIRGVQDMDILWTEMKKAGFTETQIEKAAFKNVLRVVRDCMRAPGK